MIVFLNALIYSTFLVKKHPYLDIEDGIRSCFTLIGNKISVVSDKI